jgi:hypothetical protein
MKIKALMGAHWGFISFPFSLDHVWKCSKNTKSFWFIAFNKTRKICSGARFRRLRSTHTLKLSRFQVNFSKKLIFEGNLKDQQMMLRGGRELAGTHLISFYVTTMMKKCETVRARSQKLFKSILRGFAGTWDWQKGDQNLFVFFSSTPQ